LHGCAKIDCNDGDYWCGQYKNGKKDGYWAEKHSNGIFSYYQYKNDSLNGYGIQKDLHGNFYRGEFINDSYHGYGLKDYEWYDGPWEKGYYHGVGVFKEKSTGRVERSLYNRGRVICVFEVIEQGQ
jgi:hypothetical protein